MTSIWLVLTNPYAYDQALSFAVEEAQKIEAELRVVFFIEAEGLQTMVGELSERGWYGPGSLQNLQKTMLEGYRALAGDVLKRVKRKAAPLSVIDEGVVEQPSLDKYIGTLIKEPMEKLIISSANLPNAELDNLLDKIDWITEG